MKKALVSLFLVLVLVAIPCQAGFLDFFADLFTGHAVASMEDQCKRYVSINEGDIKVFAFGNDEYQINLLSVDSDSAALLVNNKRYDLLIPSARVAVNPGLSITLTSKIQQDDAQGVLVTLNKEDDKCSCVSNDITISKGAESAVSDGKNDFRIAINDFNYDVAYQYNSYATYYVNGYVSDKAFISSTVTIWSLNGLKIKTKTISPDGKAVIMIDNSGNCNASLTNAAEEEETVSEPEAQLPAETAVNLGTDTLLQITDYLRENIIYSLTIPSKNQESTFITTPEGRFNLHGERVADEAAPAPKGFWAELFGL